MKFRKQQKENKENQLIDNIWSGKKKQKLNLNTISLYHLTKIQLKSKNKEDFNFISNSTWTDLNMNDVFFHVNRTCSSIGSQYLFHQMHYYKNELNFPKKKFEIYKKFQSKNASSKKFAKILLPLRDNRSSYISRMLFNSFPKKPVYFPLIITLPLLFLASIAGLFFIGKEFILAVLLFGIINSLFHKVISFRMSEYIPDMGSLGRMLNVASSLAKTGETEFKEIQILIDHKSFIKYIHKKFGWLLIDIHNSDDLSASVIAYFNHLLLVNVIVFFSASKYVNMHKKELIEIFEAIGSLDISIAITKYLDSKSYCIPNIIDENKISVVSIFHPVLNNPVANSFELTNHSSLITGSNMAGKTTFIKTIGVNCLRRSYVSTLAGIMFPVLAGI